MPIVRIATVVAALALAPLTLAAQHQHGATEHRKAPTAEKSHEMMHGASWKEMDAFHALLAATYHPAADGRTLAPLRSRGDSLAQAAAVWAAAKPPASCASDEVTAAISSIAKDAQALAQQLKTDASDAELTKAITALHDRFETVEGRCGGHGGMKGMKHE